MAESRNKRGGDTIYNARRRFRRKAQRYYDQARKSVGAMKSRLLTLAKDMLEDAISTYDAKTDRSKVSKPIKDLAEKLNVEIENVKLSQDKLDVVARSFESLEKQPEKMGTLSRREREAKSILQQGNIKNRFYGGLVDIWQDAQTKTERDELIKQHFNAESLMDVLEELEKAGINLYKAASNEEYYDSVKVKIADYASKTQAV